MFNFLYITNDPEIASFVESCGVNRIFIDLERMGKQERQGHLDTVISKHDFSDIVKVKEVLKQSELLVRLNPLHSGSQDEINQAVENGADIIMQPMFNSVDEVSRFGAMINGRAKFIPLVETIESSKICTQICDISFVDEIHIGLNDLHLEFEMKFMFELIANGYVEDMVANLSKPFGIGGIARLNQGDVSGKLVMSQHVKLGSSAVILSRAFHLRATKLSDLKDKIDLKVEIDDLNSIRTKFLSMSKEKLYEFDTQFKQAVEKVKEYD